MFCKPIPFTADRRGAALAGISMLSLMVCSALTQAQTADTVASEEIPEIIVTAQHRSEHLQDVPVAITVLSTAQLEQAAVTNMRDLSAVSPGLLAIGAGAFISPAIRGVHSDQTDPGNDANVATYVDNVYQPNQQANAMDFPDVSRIEVLKGPQGTLFGRNATGGAIRIFTSEPSLTTASGNFDVGYGNYNDVSVKGFATTPLIADKLAASVAGGYETRDGYTYDIVNNVHSTGLDSRSVRVKLLAQPLDNLSLELFDSYAYRSDGDTTAYTALNGNSAARGIPGAIIPTQPYQFTTNYGGEPIFKSTTYTSGLRATLDTGAGQFTSNTAYFAAEAYGTNDADVSSVDLLSYPVSEKQTQESEELIFTSDKFDRYQITGGAFYYKAIGRYDPLELQGSDSGGGLYGYMRQGTHADSLFGELTYDPADRLTLIAGGRYSHERRDAEGGYFSTPDSPSVLPPIGSPVAYNSFTPRASARYQLTDSDDNVYFTYSQGFKSGGFNISALQPTPFKPEKLNSYEVGLKTSPSRIVSANIAAFYYDYTNQQVSADVNGLNITTNAASSRIYGSDADITARPTPEFTLTAGVSLLDAKYKTYEGAPANVPTVGPNPAIPCLCGNTTTFLDLSGGQLPFSPKFTLSIGADYRKQLSLGALEFSAYAYHNSGYSYDAYPDVRQMAYTTLALRATYQPTGSNFSFYMWGKNVTSALYFANAIIYNTGDAVRYAMPATYGGGIRYAF